MKFHEHDLESKKVLGLVPSDDKVRKASDIFQLIGDSTRLKILWILCHCRLCVNNIAVSVSMSAPAVSHHLRILRQAGLIESERIGREIYYKAADSSEMELIHGAIDQVLNANCKK